MTDTLIIIIKCLSAILVGIFAGNGGVYFFNKMPAAWLCEYGQKPPKELLDPYTQRVKSYPWKFIFTMFFIVVGIWLVIDDYRFAIGAVAVIWLMLEMSIADIKYRIVPDQLIILLAVCAFGFISYHDSWMDCLYGGLIGFGVMGFVAVLGKIIYKKDSLGGGDIKLFASLGLIAGVSGIIGIFILTTLMSAGHFVILLAMRKIKRTDSKPMVPYIGISTTIYLIFLWGYGQMLYL